MAYSDNAGELFEDAFAKCHGELDLSLFATWVSIGVAGAFGVLSLIQLGYLMRRPTIVRAPALLLVSKLVSSHPKNENAMNSRSFLSSALASSFYK